MMWYDVPRAGSKGGRWLGHRLGLRCRAAALFWLTAITCGWLAHSAELRVDIERGEAGRAVVRLTTSAMVDRVLSLEASANLAEWRSVAVTHDAFRKYPAYSEAAQRYYRVVSLPRSATNDWKNQLLYPDDPFRAGRTQEQVDWVKFAILTNDPDRVYYQPSAAYPFHYDFAVARLPGFEGMDRAAFDALSLYPSRQAVVLGAVLLPMVGGTAEYGVQFVGLEPYAPAEIARWFGLVRDTIYSADRAGAYYIPTHEQSEVARTNQETFAALGVPVASIDRWISTHHVYSPGWAVGRLKFFAAADIAAAFADGRLAPSDLLLTDGVPAETPPVAGIISLRPSTPNSHTAILSRSFGIPFVYFPEATDQARVQGLAGRRVLLRGSLTSYGAARVDIYDVEATLTPEAEGDLRELRQPPPLRYAPKRSYGAFSAATDSLIPADIQYFGGKAANYGFLRRAVPSNSPPAVAFSFDLWDAYMDQPVSGATRTLREEIASRLAVFTNYPPPVAELQNVLAQIRTLVRSGRFSPDQQAAIVDSLRGFDASRKIRFRSSTNVEDSEYFTGAGLYDSYSGCLLDDLDADSTGPSLCDPAEAQERGVFRAMQRVFASFYNDHAFLERLRHGLDETTVAMGVLVHHSFPDPDELANGVATLNFRSAGAWEQIGGEMVTQKGAVSVTNPDGSALPEVVTWERFGGKTYLSLNRYSSLVPLGERVLGWEAEYQAFTGLFLEVTRAFRDAAPERTRFTLDFEYKKDRLLGLVVKQVREVPDPAATGPSRTYLLDAPVPLVVAQKEAGDVFGNHRLKSRWDFRARNAWLVDSNLTQGFYAGGALEYVEAGGVASLSGPLAGWPEASLSSNGLTNFWTTGSGPERRRWRLETAPPATGAGIQPVYTLADLPKYVFVTFQQPQPVIDYHSETLRSEAMAVLEPERQVDSGSIRVERDFTTNAVAVRTVFYWPRPPGGMDAGYTAPLVKFVETRITGLTGAPLVLTGYYSQTYRPGHHNFTEEFIFEPGLDAAVPEEEKAALVAANIRLIYLHLGGPEYGRVLGWDGKFRPL